MSNLIKFDQIWSNPIFSPFLFWGPNAKWFMTIWGWFNGLICEVFPAQVQWQLLHPCQKACLKLGSLDKRELSSQPWDPRLWKLPQRRQLWKAQNPVLVKRTKNLAKKWGREFWKRKILTNWESWPYQRKLLRLQKELRLLKKLPRSWKECYPNRNIPECGPSTTATWKGNQRKNKKNLIRQARVQKECWLHSTWWNQVCQSFFTAVKSWRPLPPWNKRRNGSLRPKWLSSLAKRNFGSTLKVEGSAGELTPGPLGFGITRTMGT